MDIHEIVKKLIGEIDPVGETNTDDKRFESLKVMTDLIDKLHRDIENVLFYNKESQLFSKKRAADHVNKFLDMIGVKE